MTTDSGETGEDEIVVAAERTGKRRALDEGGEGLRPCEVGDGSIIGIDFSRGICGWKRRYGEAEACAHEAAEKGARRASEGGESWGGTRHGGFKRGEWGGSFDGKWL